jgi:outer membrane receptor protein involved in Fe transport
MSLPTPLKLKKAVLAFLLSCISILSFSQTIKGKVTDQSNGEPLVGAVVKIEALNISTLSKLDGTFVFTKVKTGTYKLSVSFEGYKKSKEITVTVTASGTQAINVALESTAAELASVTVSSGINKDDKGARKLEKIADPLVNILSAKTIQLLPDITVANALQRVSGVTIEKSGSGEARYPIIRGMEKRYINTLVNGIKIPSPDNKSRYIPLDLFPSELLERLEVSKSLTASMEGDAIGGSINLVMKDAPNKWLFQANAALGYNTSFLNERYNQFSTNSMQILSPNEVKGSSYIATPKDFTVAHLIYSNLNRPVNSTFGLTVGNRFGNSKQFGFILSGSYQNIYRGTTSNFFLPNAQPGLDNVPIFSELQLRKYSVQSQRFALNGKFDFHINKNNKISLTNTFVRLDDYQTRIVFDTVTLNSVVDHWQRSQWQYQSIYNSNLQGLHQVTSTFKIDWSLVYSVANNHIPDQSQFIHQYAIVPTSLTQDKLQKMNRIWLHNKDQDYAAYINFTKSTNIFNKPVEVKFGGLIRNKTRDNYYASYTMDPQLGALYTNINNAAFIFNPTSSGMASATGNNYTFTEDVSAGFFQTKWQLNKKLEAIAGVRVEYTNQHYETQLGPDVDAKSGTIWYTDVLPSMHFKYAINQKQNLRLAYYKALARPGFAELIPDGTDGEFFKERGDPINLQHTLADNIDLRYELYPGGADQLLLGVFYKNIKEPIEISAVKPQGVNNLYLMPLNIGTATNYGFEAVFTKYFGVFGITANYTYTQSKIKDSLLLSYRNTAGSIVTKRVEETRPLQGQSNHIANLSLIYKNPKIGLDVQTAFVYTGERISFLSPYYGLHYWQSPTAQLDISFEKRIIKKLTFYGKINNLTNTPFELSVNKSYNAYLSGSGGRPLALQTDPDNKIFIQKDYYKTSYLFGIRYKL